MSGFTDFFSGNFCDDGREYECRPQVINLTPFATDNYITVASTLDQTVDKNCDVVFDKVELNGAVFKFDGKRITVTECGAYLTEFFANETDGKIVALNVNAKAVDNINYVPDNDRATKAVILRLNKGDRLSMTNNIEEQQVKFNQITVNSYKAANCVMTVVKLADNY